MSIGKNRPFEGTTRLVPMKWSGKTPTPILLCIWALLPSFALAQAKYDIKKVNEHVYIFTELWDANTNGNMGVVVGDKQVLLINSMMLGSASDLEKEIRKITDLPIGFVINSDSDPYNHHANKYFADRGAIIISHENMKFSTAYHQILFSDRISIPIGGETVTAYYTPSHTLDHIDVFLENSNVLFMSDGFQPHWFIYTGPNGIQGVLTGIDRAISLSNTNTLIVPGNTSKDPKLYFGSKRHLIRNKDILEKFSKKVEQLFNSGLNVDEMISDGTLNKLVMELEAYPVMKPYLKYYIMELLEVDIAPNYDLTTEELVSYTGTYLSDGSGPIEVLLEDERLFARQEHGFYFELKPISKEKFDFKGPTSDDFLIFHFLPSGEVEGLTPILEAGGWWSNSISSETYVKQKKE